MPKVDPMYEDGYRDGYETGYNYSRSAIEPANPVPPTPTPAPVDMILFCPVCMEQHIDKPEPETDWTNPPHKSHRCRRCRTIWRPADVPTNGVVQTATKGSADTWGILYLATPAEHVHCWHDHREATVCCGCSEHKIVASAEVSGGEAEHIVVKDEGNGWSVEAWYSSENAADTAANSLRSARLQRRLFDECVIAGWDPERRNTFAEEVAHLHEELSEAFRAWRLYKDFKVHIGANGKLEGVPIELADTLIGLFYNAELHGFDLLAAVEQKHQFNLTRNYVIEGRQLHTPEPIAGTPPDKCVCGEDCGAVVAPSVAKDEVQTIIEYLCNEPENIIDPV